MQIRHNVLSYIQHLYIIGRCGNSSQTKIVKLSNIGEIHKTVRNAIPRAIN